MGLILQLLALILILLLDLYLAEKYKKKYNIFQNPILKYKELNSEHKNKTKLTVVVSLPLFILVTINFGITFNKIFEIVAYCLAAFFLVIALLDLYYQKDKNVFEQSVKRISYVYSVCVISFVFLFWIQ